MPYTKRIPHYGTPQDLIEYILDEKNYGEKIAVASSLNCNVETALSDFMRTQKRFNMQGNRVAYHIIQSFSPNDSITPAQANRIGKKLCQELYPNYECVISTHMDKGHIHNHIALNAINLNGTKLNDRLGDTREGLYGLSNTSDKIAAQYGCYIMPKRTFSKIKNKDYYYQYKEQSWKQKIKEDIENLLIKCSSLEELLEELSISGYEIKRGKYISVKIMGMQRFARLSTIDKKYTEQNLYKYYQSQNNIKLLGIKTSQNEFNSILFRKANESKEAIEKTQLAIEGKRYCQYQKTRYEEIKRYYQLKQQLEYLDKYNIKSFNDIENQIENKRLQMKSLNKDLKKNKDKFNEIIERTEKAQDYIKLYKDYQYAMSYKEIDEDYVLPAEVELFLSIQNELNIHSVDEAKQLIKASRLDRITINKLKKEVLDLQRELNHLDTIKEEKLSNSSLFIHNIKFGSNRIDYKLSNDEYFCINLPYTKEKVYIKKKYTAFNEKHQYYTLYLVDDKEYELYDENNKLMKNITGIELEQYVLDKKKEIDKGYSEIKVA
ncbi:MAG: relaxase/mobilization nuclease domain-containing protein [Clostridia bacterium]|nr:relaxase/mobilization nuclease domain-containing protein [Clostridia bacterium]